MTQTMCVCVSGCVYVLLLIRFVVQKIKKNKSCMVTNSVVVVVVIVVVSNQMMIEILVFFLHFVSPMNHSLNDLKSM